MRAERPSASVLLALPEVEHEATSLSEVDYDGSEEARLGSVRVVELF